MTALCQRYQGYQRRQNPSPSMTQQLIRWRSLLVPYAAGRQILRNAMTSISRKRLRMTTTDKPRHGGGGTSRFVDAGAKTGC